MKKIAWSAVKSFFRGLKGEIHEIIIFVACLYCVQVLSEAFLNESQTHDLMPLDYLYFSIGAALFLIPNTAIRAIKEIRRPGDMPNDVPATPSTTTQPTEGAI
jgi:hypothetical protein